MSETAAPGSSGRRRAPAAAALVLGLSLVAVGMLVWRVSQAAFGYGWFAYSPSSGDASSQGAFTCLLSWTTSLAVAGLIVVLGACLVAAAIGTLAGGSATGRTRTSAVVALAGLVLAMGGYLAVRLLRVQTKVLVVDGDAPYDLAMLPDPAVLWSWSAPQLVAAGLGVVGLAVLAGACAFRAAAPPTP